MSNSKKLWITLVALLLAASVGAVALKKRAQLVVEAPPVSASGVLEFLPTDVTPVSARDLRRTLPLSGSLRAVNQVSVKAKVAGEVREVLVREGEAVKAGQVLVKMDSSDFQARLEQTA